MKSSAGKIKLDSLDILFQTGGMMAQEIPLSELFPYRTAFCNTRRQSNERQSNGSVGHHRA